MLSPDELKGGKTFILQLPATTDGGRNARAAHTGGNPRVKFMLTLLPLSWSIGGNWKLLMGLGGIVIALAIVVWTVRASGRSGEALRRRERDAAPGRFRVAGVNTLQATRVVEYITADNKADARTKGQLLGIQVASVDQA